MGGIARDEFQAQLDGNGGDHWVATADWLADAIQLPGDLPSKVGGGLAENQNLFRLDGVAKGLNPRRATHPLKALDDFHDRNDRERQDTVGLTIGDGIAGNVFVYAFADFRQNIRIEKGLIHRDRPATG